MHKRTHKIIGGGLAVVAATLSFSGLAMSNGDAAAARTGSCTLKTVDIAPGAINGEDFGTLKCSKPFGKGVQHNRSVLTPTSATTGRLDGKSHLYFKTGSVLAKFRLEYELDGSNIEFQGTAKVVKGTSAYKGITGSAKLAGSSQDGGTHSTITETLSVKLP